jgi:hypothetical protein
MKRLLSAFERRLAPYRRKLLHLVFFSSLGGLVAGWSFLDRLGPMSVMLPAVLAIGAGLSEVDHLFRTEREGDGGRPKWKLEKKNAVN